MVFDVSDFMKIGFGVRILGREEESVEIWAGESSKASVLKCSITKVEWSGVVRTQGT